MKSIDYRKEDRYPVETAVALGKFEGLHRGHRLLIDGAAEYARSNDCDSVIFTIFQPGSARIYTREERVRILEAAGVDADMECAFTSDFMALLPEDFVKLVLVNVLRARCVFVGAVHDRALLRAFSVIRCRQSSPKSEKPTALMSAYLKSCA